MRTLRLLTATAGVGAAFLVATGPAPAAVQKHHKAARHHRVAKAAKGSVVISTRKIKGLGTVLVGKKGLTLYMFVPDKQKKVTCTGTCAAIWPPVKVTAHGKIVTKGGAKSKLVGRDPNPSGGDVATYRKWPLYYYVSDTKPGQARGQALNLNGGLWYVLSPSGKVIKTKPA